jgi:hypothetical protein
LNEAGSRFDSLSAVCRVCAVAVKNIAIEQTMSTSFLIC